MVLYIFLWKKKRIKNIGRTNNKKRIKKQNKKKNKKKMNMKKE